ncbi:MAG: DUF2269 family protein [Dehalococcoidia bacterium]
MIWRLVHILALFWMMAGVGNTVPLIWRAWSTNDLERKSLLLSEAQTNESTWLLPGLIATGITGFAWAAAEDWNLVRTGWLLALEVVFALDVFIFVPLMGVGLRRVRYLALQAQKRGQMTDELRSALADNVPIVFGTLVVLTIPLMVWLPVAQPF